MVVHMVCWCLWDQDIGTDLPLLQYTGDTLVDHIQEIHNIGIYKDLDNEISKLVPFKSSLCRVAAENLEIPIMKSAEIYPFN